MRGDNNAGAVIASFKHCCPAVAGVCEHPGAYALGIAEYEPTVTSKHVTDTPKHPRPYLLLLENDLNRVYNQSLAAVAAAELQWVTDGLLPFENRLSNIEPTSFGRAAGLLFSTSTEETALTAIVSQLSCALALFATSSDDKPTNSQLTPIPLPQSLVYGTELVTTQRYRGKTNERLTRAMLNLALATAGIPLSGPWNKTPTLLDPMCGRGTTLNWALAYGCNAVGVEPDASALKQYETFITTWAKQQRLPHKRQTFRSNNAEKRLFTLDVAPTRADQKAGTGQKVETFAADGGDTTLHIKKQSIDVIVGDLPYGVQHRSDPAALDPPETVDLVARLAPTWRRWVRRGGAVCLAWNTRRASRADMLVALVDSGFELPSGWDFDGVVGAEQSMAHRVDASISRDVLLVIKP